MFLCHLALSYVVLLCSLFDLEHTISKLTCKEKVKTNGQGMLPELNGRAKVCIKLLVCDK